MAAYLHRMETTTPSQPLPQMLTVAELAKHLQVDRITIRRWIASGKIPAVKIGRSYRIPAEAVAQILEGATQ